MQDTKQATNEFPYYCFRVRGSEKYYEGRFWNQGGLSLAVVAVVNQFGEHGDWAAYIGSSKFKSYTHTLVCVADYGCKLSERDAEHFFPDINLPYRW